MTAEFPPLFFVSGKFVQSWEYRLIELSEAYNLFCYSIIVHSYIFYMSAYRLEIVAQTYSLMTNDFVRFRQAILWLAIWTCYYPCVFRTDADVWPKALRVPVAIKGQVNTNKNNEISVKCIGYALTLSLTLMESTLLLTILSRTRSVICSKPLASMSSITVPFSSRLLSSKSECSDRVATWGLLQRLPPSSTSSSNLIHLRKTQKSIARNQIIV